MQLCYPPWSLQCYLGAHISYFLFCMQKSFPFPPLIFACNKGNSRHLHADLEDVTNKNCLPNLVLNVNWWSHSAVYNWHHWYQCCEIWDLFTLADKLRIVFETSKLKIAWWQFCFWKIDSHWKLFTINSPSHLST